MLTQDNYKQLMTEYQSIKLLVKDLELTKDEFLEHIKIKSPLGVKFLKFFNSLNDGADVETEINDFVEIMFGEKNGEDK